MELAITKFLAINEVVPEEIVYGALLFKQLINSILVKYKSFDHEMDFMIKNKAKNAEILGLRFSISFLRMKNEPGHKFMDF